MAIIAKDKEIDKKALETPIITTEQIEGIDDVSELMPVQDEVYELASRLLTTDRSLEKQQWYRLLKDRDSEVKADLNIRKNSAVSIPHSIIYDENDSTSTEAGELVKYVLYNKLGSKNNPNDFKQICSYLLSAVSESFAVMETIFEPHEQYLIPAQLKDWDQINFDYNLAGQLVWVTKKESDDKGIVLQEGKFIVHCPEYTSENPTGVSVLGVSVFWAFYLKRMALKDWAQFCERFAKPFFWGTHPNSGVDEKGVKDFLAQIAGLYMKRAGCGREEYDVKILEASGQGSNSLEKFIRYLDSQIAIAILGQANTTDSSSTGSFARDKVSKSITDEIIINDIVELQSTLNRWIRFWVTMNFPEIETVPTIEFDTAPPENLKEEISIYKDLQDMGMSLSISQMRKKFNIATPESEEDTLVKTSTSSPLIDPDLPDDNDIEDGDEVEEDQPELPSILNNKASKKKRVNIYSESELEAYIKGENKAQDKSTDRVIHWTESAVKKTANALNPFLDKIISQLEKNITKPDQLDDIKPDNKTIAELESIYFDISFFEYMYGQLEQRVELIPALNYELKQPNLMLYANTTTQSSSLIYPDIVFPFEKAVEFFTDKIPTLTEELPDIEDKLRVKAFWLTKNNIMHAITRTKELLQQALDKGIGVKDWIKDNKKLFTKLGFNVQNPYYLENVHRTNALSAYSAGRYKQQVNPIAAAVLNVWRFYNPDDARTSDVCRLMVGKIALNTDPIWNIYYPPNHYQCRSSIVAMSKAMARRHGYTVPTSNIQSPEIKNIETGKIETVKPLEGFQTNIGKNWLDTNKEVA